MQRSKRDIPVQALIEWAFRVECASLDLPDPNPAEERGFGFGMEYVLIERAKLGGVRIDTSIGSSSPHEDAEAVAAAVLNLPDDLGGRRMAIAIAEYGRSGITPDWMPGAVPKIEPRDWNGNQHGWRGKSELCGHWPERKFVGWSRKGRRIFQEVKHEIRWVPITWTITRQEIDAARAHYQAWRDALAYLRDALRHGTLRKHTVSDALPPSLPWLRPRHAPASSSSSRSRT